MGPETDQMVQFLAPETDIMGEQNYIQTPYSLGFGRTKFWLQNIKIKRFPNYMKWRQTW